MFYFLTILFVAASIGLAIALKNKAPKIEALMAALISLLVVLVVIIIIARIFGQLGS